MSKAKALKKLSARVPSPEELETQLQGLIAESDRSVAIVATSIVEELLARVLALAIKSDDADLPNQLFNNRGPLSDFHGKVIVAKAFGIIPPNVATELMTMKAIRNAFAHSIQPLSFSTPEIAALMEDFIMLSAGDAEFTKRGEGLRLRTGDKSDFIITCRLLCIILDAQIQRAGGKHTIYKFNDLDV